MLKRRIGRIVGVWLLNVLPARLIFFPKSDNSKVAIDIFA